MWHRNWREEIWSDISQEWDLIIVGGGITGAGIFREATHLGLRTLLVEQRDFAWGTSSRSSKLVHGGLRYLKEGRIRLTRDSVREREQLLKDAPGLVEPMDFLLATYDGDSPGRLTVAGDFVMADGAGYEWELDGSGLVAGVDYDTIAVGDELIMEGDWTLSFVHLSGSAGPGDKFYLFEDFPGGQTGNVTPLLDTSMVDLGDWDVSNVTFDIDAGGLYMTGLAVVPEPSTFLLAMIGLLGTLGWRRRRRG